MTTTPSIQILIQADEVELMRSVPGLKRVVDRYEETLRELNEYAGAIQQARDEYTDDELEIDDHPTVSAGGDPGVWVSAWVWVSIPEDEDDA
jgi:hypothetical protein